MVTQNPVRPVICTLPLLVIRSLFLNVMAQHTGTHEQYICDSLLDSAPDVATSHICPIPSSNSAPMAASS